MTSSRPKIKVLEINNYDIFGKRFNGYSLQKYINHHPETNISVNFIVNHKFSSDPSITKLFPNSNFEKYDWEVEGIEKDLAIKNQISISEAALISHPLFKQADILHFQMYHNCLLPIEFLTRIPADKKIILEFHDSFWMTDTNIPMLEAFSYSDGPNKTSLDTQRQRVLHSIDAECIVHSPYLMHIAKQSSATKDLNLHLIEFGINTKIFRPLSKSKLFRNNYKIPKNHIVLMCRAQKAFKGVEYIKAALANIDTSRKITLITVDNTGLFDSLKSKINIIEFGQVESESKMAHLYNLCDIFLAPSTEESFGFMAVEAMACGTPVIVFEGTALPQTTNAPDIGIATPRSSKALAAAIISLINNPKDRLARGQAGRDYVLQHYTEKKYFDSYISLFHKLAEKPKRHIIPTPITTPPSNLTAFEEHLANHNHQSKLFDYNDYHIQQAILKYNNNTYRNIKKYSRKHPIRTFIKSNTPQFVKKIYNKTRKKFVCLKNKIFH